MVEGKRKSRTFARKHVSVTKGSTTRYIKRKPGRARCADTGQKLHGVPHARSVDMKRLSPTQRRPARPYGGKLSSQSMRDTFKEKARNIDV